MPERKEIVSVDRRPDGPSSPGSGDSSNGSQQPEAIQAVRRRLPDERRSLTHHFSVGGQEGYVTVGLYEDELPGELFIRMAKRARPFPASWTRSQPRCLWLCSTECHCKSFATSSVTHGLNQAVGREIRKSDMPSLLWIICSAGSNCVS